MTPNKFLIILLISLIAGLSYSQSWQYANSFGGQNGESDFPNNQPNNLVTDYNGNAYVYGTYGAGTQFNDSSLTSFVDDTRGGFVAKFSCNGDVEWFKSISNTEQRHDQASYMLLKDDYLYLYGSCRIDNFYKTWFLDTLVIGSVLVLDYPDNCEYPWIPFRNYSYLIKMDLNGNIINYHLFSLYNDDLAKTDNIYDLWNNPSNQRAFAIDNEENYYFFMRLKGDQTSVVFCDNLPVSDTITPLIPQSPFYLIKFDNNFNMLWYKSVVQDISNHDLYGVGIDFNDFNIDSQNNLYIAGYLQTIDTSEIPEYPVNISLGSGQQLRTYQDENKIGFLLKMNSDGEPLWTLQSESFGTVSNCSFESLILDEETNNIYVQGRAVHRSDFLPDSYTIFNGTDTISCYYPESLGSTSGIILNCNLDGEFDWVTSPTAIQSYLGSISLFNNKLYGAVKWNSPTFEHGGETYEYPYGTKGLTICTWDTLGNQLESINVESTCTGMAGLASYDTRVNSFGEIITTGTYDYGLTFGDHYIYGEGFKMFIAKYGNPCPIITDETETFCYGEEYNGTVLTESGDYNFVLESSQPEVDSIVNLHATVFPQLTTGINDTTFCKDELFTLEADAGYNTYNWSTGSETSEEELSFSTAGTENVYVTLTDDYCSGVDTIVITIEVCNFTEEQQMPQLSLYPVPADTHITVQLSDKQAIEAYSVYNLNGQLIETSDVNNMQSVHIKTNELPSGQYIIYLKTKDGFYSAGFIKE